MGKVYVVSSGKGGTGKTMFAVNFGSILAKRGKSVVLIDLDMGLRRRLSGIRDLTIYISWHHHLRGTMDILHLFI